MLKSLRKWVKSWADYREMSEDWERVLSALPSSPSTTGADTVRWYASGRMPWRRQWAWIQDSPSVEVTDAERQGLLPGKGARAVDFSSGVGRNSLFLLKRGLHVRSIAYPDDGGVQISFQKKWADRYLRAYPDCGSIDIVPGEFARYELREDPFDLVVCVNSLMYVPMSVGREAIRSLQRQTAAGGLHLITTYTIDDCYNGLPAVSEDHFITSGRLDDDQLQCLYPESEWEHFESSPRLSSSPNDNRGRRRSRSVVIAKKKFISGGN